MEKVVEIPSLSLRKDLHLKRKIWHMGGGSFFIFLYYRYPQIPMQYWVSFLGSMTVLVFLMEWARLKVPIFNTFFMTYFHSIMREGEKNKISGVPYFILGCFLSVFFYSEKIAVLSILFLIFADPLSSLGGILLGKTKIMGGKKSLEGGLVGLWVCFTLSFFYCMGHLGPEQDILLFSVWGAIIGCLSEVFSTAIDDNLTIPVVSGAGLALANFFLQIF